MPNNRRILHPGCVAGRKWSVAAVEKLRQTAFVLPYAQ